MTPLAKIQIIRSKLPNRESWNNGNDMCADHLYGSVELTQTVFDLLIKAEDELGTCSKSVKELDYDTVQKIFDLTERYARLIAFV